MKKPVNREIFRIIDANFNRSREGLRVCEDITRFVLNSPTLSGELKAVRHSISAILKSMGAEAADMLAEARDSERDIGRCSKRPSEMARQGFRGVFSANIERVKESLRALEEFFKLINAGHSRKFAGLRFTIYEIEKRAIRKFRPVRNT